jgi:hypothetical protein
MPRNPTIPTRCFTPLTEAPKDPDCKTSTSEAALVRAARYAAPHVQVLS